MYRERTHGVYIQRHDSAVVWQFRDADPEFAMIQSKELEDQLRQLLRTLGAVVIRGDDYIEVCPRPRLPPPPPPLPCRRPSAAATTPPSAAMR